MNFGSFLKLNIDKTDLCPPTIYVLTIIFLGFQKKVEMQLINEILTFRYGAAWKFIFSMFLVLKVHTG